MKNTLLIEIKPIYEIKEILPRNGYIIISMDSKYNWMGDKSNVCILRYADTEDKNHPDAVSYRHVQEVANFMNHCGRDSEKLIISCDSGQSRSPALAAALLSVYGYDDEYIWKNPKYKPNILVFRTSLEYYGPYAPSDKLKDVSIRTPEAYRYFRKHGSDPVFEYDRVINRNVSQKSIRYGFKDGDIRQILFIKVGGGGDIIGAEEKYLKAAAYLHELYGCTVIVSSNPYDGSDSLYDAEDVVREYLKENAVCEVDAEVLFFGYSDGAKLIADYGHEHDLFSSIILHNLPLEQSETENIAKRLDDINKCSSIIVVYGEEDEAYKAAGQRLHRLVPEIEMHVIKRADHRLSTRLATILPQLFFMRNALVANGVIEKLL